MKNRTMYLFIMIIVTTVAISFLLLPIAKDLFQKIFFSGQPANYYDIFYLISVVSLMTTLAGITIFCLRCELKFKKENHTI